MVKYGLIRLSALFSRCIFTSFFGLSVSWFRDFSGLYWGLKFIYQNGLFSNVFESFLMITASSHALFCADCTMECMKYQIFVQKNYIASVFFKVFIWMFEQDYIFFFTSIEEKKWLNHFLCKYFKKVVEANVHLICIMKLKLLLQLEITIKAQLNKMMVICLWKKYMYFFWNKSYIFDTVRSSHQSVRGSSGQAQCLVYSLWDSSDISLRQWFKLWPAFTIKNLYFLPKL